MSYRHPILLRQRFAPVRNQPSYNSYDYEESDENHPPTFQNNDRPEPATSSFPPRKSFIDTIVTRNDEYWQNRVTLKLDVPFTDHSHIIGRGGKNTQAVMKQTACHIHFPDSNKNHDSDKSNQVSIAGPIGKVETARSRIRGLAPLSISFELKGMLPTVNVDQLVADACLEKTLGFAELNIVVRTNRASGQPYCLVRGSAHQMDMMIEACEALRRLFFPPDTPVSYSTSLEVLPAQQASVIGRNGRHIDWIAQKTGATVHFPSASDCQRGASTFYIAGSINAILDARKHILGLLPVLLTFEVRKGNAKAVQPDPAVVEQLLGVTLTVKYRPNGGDQGAKAVTVRSCEYNLTNVYAVRAHLVDSTDEVVLCADYDFMRDMRAVIEQPIGQPSSPNHTDANACFPPPMQSLTPSHLASTHPLLFNGFNQFLLQQNGINMPLHQLTTASYMQQQLGLPPPQSMLMAQQQQQYAQQSQYQIQPQLYANSLMQQQHTSLPMKQWMMSEHDRTDCQSAEMEGSAW
uniref:K Homology domain-containing protein n=1 Tax=Plectus sambesii TaxID=2011161 RepID=A0A914UNN9_9BILA